MHRGGPFTAEVRPRLKDVALELSRSVAAGIYERKFELDSPLALLKLSTRYHEATRDLHTFLDDRWIDAVTADGSAASKSSSRRSERLRILAI